MTRQELRRLWGQTLRSDGLTVRDLDVLAQAIVDVLNSDTGFRQHIENRSKRVTEATGQPFDPNRFDIDMARAFIADEIGVISWSELLKGLKEGFPNGQPILFRYAVAALWRGDFTALEETIGRDDFDRVIKAWYDEGYFSTEPETFAETFAAACWLGHAKTVGFLLDHGVDPYAGMRTGLAGFHWAASSGKRDVIKLLIARQVPMEVKSMYDSTPLGQALWSAINEHTDSHATIIESLIEGGAHVWPETLEWWLQQDVPSETKTRVANALRRHG